MAEPNATETLERMKTAVRRLLNQVGDPSTCRSCGAEIWWIRTKAGKRMPMNRLAESHFVDCPHADAHRKTRRKPR